MTIAKPVAWPALAMNHEEYLEIINMTLTFAKVLTHLMWNNLIVSWHNASSQTATTRRVYLHSGIGVLICLDSGQEHQQIQVAYMMRHRSCETSFP